jgi:hypothetical protein
MVGLAPGFEAIPTITGPMTRNVDDLHVIMRVPPSLWRLMRSC